MTSFLYIHFLFCKAQIQPSRFILVVQQYVLSCTRDRASSELDEQSVMGLHDEYIKCVCFTWHDAQQTGLGSYSCPLADVFVPAGQRLSQNTVGPVRVPIGRKINSGLSINLLTNQIIKKKVDKLPELLDVVCNLLR